MVTVSVAQLPNFIKFDEALKRLYISDISSHTVVPGVYIVEFILDDSYEKNRYQITITVLYNGGGDQVESSVPE